jgi:hypothetical protein
MTQHIYATDSPLLVMGSVTYLFLAPQLFLVFLLSDDFGLEFCLRKSNPLHNPRRTFSQMITDLKHPCQFIFQELFH